MTRTVKKAAAKKATKKATAKKVAKKSTRPSIASLRESHGREMAQLIQAHEAWKLDFVRDALEFAEDQGYCDEVERFLEDQGFDLDKLKESHTFHITFDVEMLCRPRAQASDVRQEIHNFLSSWQFDSALRDYSDESESVDVSNVVVTGGE